MRHESNAECRVVYDFNDLLNIFPFGKTRLLDLCQSGVLPVVKVGRKYLSTPDLIDEWFRENQGKEVL